MQPGDVFIINDPFDGGIHLPDIFIVKPVLFEGEVIGFTCTTAHHGDVGGRLPGSSACDNTEIFQEGMRLPWLQLYDAGEPVEDVFKIIEANVRIPRMTFGDLGAQVAACASPSAPCSTSPSGTARRARGVLEALIDHTERLVRQEIATWPDGSASFTDYLDSDGIDVCDVPITAHVTIAGDEVTVDLTDSAPMVRGALNSTRSFVQACAYQAVRAALTVEVPNTAGAFRPINVLTQPGHGRGGRHARRVLDARRHRLPRARRGQRRARAADPRAGARGRRRRQHARDLRRGPARTASRFVFYELVVGTWGGTPEADGNDGLTNPASLAANIPVEVAEQEYPIVVERYGLVPDSGGAGRHRGGLAVERVWRCLTPDTSLIVRSDRATHPPYGLAGGAAGAPSSNVLVRPDGSQRGAAADVLDRDRGRRRLRAPHAGGGGWGDPLERDPAAVAADVLDEKVSAAAARRAYGVVVAADGTVDQEATAA